MLTISQTPHENGIRNVYIVNIAKIINFFSIRCY